MANDVIEKTPSAVIRYDDFDFTDDLPGDTSITGAVTAINSAGTDASATVVGTVSVSGMSVRAVLQAGSNGEDYLVTFAATGVTTAQVAHKQLELRVRSKLTGAL